MSYAATLAQRTGPGRAGWPYRRVVTTASRWTPAGYLDAASGLPLHPAAVAAAEVAQRDGWADPGRRYASGRRARILLDAARESVAAAVGARPDEVHFSGSGTAAVELALAGLARARHRVGRAVVAGAVERGAVLRTAGAIAGDELVTVGVDRTGRVEVAQFVDAVRRPGVVAACLQTANHEVGTRQPLAAVIEATRAVDVPLLVDATASLGQVAVPAEWDVLTAGAHTWGGPASVGVLAVRSGVRWSPPQPADHPDVVGAVTAAAALEAARADTGSASRRHALVARLREELPRRVPDVEVVGAADDRLPHIVTFSCLYVDGEAVTDALDRAGFAVSSGSACVADSLTPSHVLVAMGVLTHGNVRVSLPPDATADDVERFLAVLPDVVARLRQDAGVAGL